MMMRRVRHHRHEDWLLSTTAMPGNRKFIHPCKAAVLKGCLTGQALEVG